jgi:hypothetical protein
MHTRTLFLVGSCAIALVACQKNKPTDTNTASSTSVTAASATVTASAKPAPKPFKDPSEDSSLASADVLPTGTPVSAKTLALYDWPIPKNVPADALWTATDAEKDGYTHTNIMKGKEGWASFIVFDCRYDGVRKMAGKPLSEANVFAYCFVTMPDKFKGYPSFAKEGGDPFRVVRAGNVVVFGDVWERKDKWKLAQLDELMGAVDWATVATW